MEEENEEKGMDTTYVGIMLVAFLALAALAIDIGYMYVTDEDLHGAAETSALAGAGEIKQRILAQIRKDPQGLPAIANDEIQAAARATAIEAASGKHHAAALIEVANKNVNRLADQNDLTVGFWDVSTRTYTPGATPVNAMQVRTRRTAESETVGLGNLGNMFSKISGEQTVNFTPDAIAALPPMATVNIALCEDACDSACRYPNVCTIAERKMIRDAWDARMDPPAKDRYAFTSLLHPITESMGLSDLICMDLPPQEVCGKQILTTRDTDSARLRDLESMMYNPNVDPSNKEIDATGKITGWWVIVPVTDCPPARETGLLEKHTVTRYALARISRICVSGTSGCQQNGTSFKAPSSTCGKEEALYIDRISYVECGKKEMLHFPGLRQVLVK